MKKLKKWVTYTGISIALIFSLIAITSYFSPWVVMSMLKNAVISSDERRLNELIDWQEIRDSFTKKTALEMLKANGIEPGDPKANEIISTVEATYEKLITPENLKLVIQKSKWDSKALIIDGEYLSMGVFIFAIENKETKSAISLRFKRQGPWSWRADRVEFLNLNTIKGL